MVQTSLYLQQQISRDYKVLATTKSIAYPATNTKINTILSTTSINIIIKTNLLLQVLLIKKLKISIITIYYHS